MVDTGQQPMEFTLGELLRRRGLRLAVAEQTFRKFSDSKLRR